MGEPTAPSPVKLIAGLLASDEEVIRSALVKLQEGFGHIDLSSETLPFDMTDYYREEMGEGLVRQWVSFSRLIDPAELDEIKRATNDLEHFFATAGRARRINIDPGYISLGNLVLASTKPSAHRVYLGRGIYAEVTLIWSDGGFKPLEWTYPDYRSDVATEFFGEVRELYRGQLREFAHD